MLERTTDVSIFWSRAIERTFSARQTSRASSSFPSKKNLTKDQKKYSPDTHGHILLLPTRSNNQQGSRCLKRSSQRLGTTAPQRASKAGANKPRLDMALCIVQTLRVFCALCPRVENNGQKLREHTQPVNVRPKNVVYRSTKVRGQLQTYSSPLQIHQHKKNARITSQSIPRSWTQVSVGALFCHGCNKLCRPANRSEFAKFSCAWDGVRCRELSSYSRLSLLTLHT